MSRPTSIKPTHDTALAGRLKIFRESFVDPNQGEAAKKLGVSHPHLSNMERGTKPVNFKVVDRLVKDYNMNVEWFTKNLGPKVLKQPEKPSAGNSLSAALTGINALEKTLEMFQVQLASAYKRIDRQDKLIESLQKRMDKIDDGK